MEFTIIPALRELQGDAQDAVRTFCKSVSPLDSLVLAHKGEHIRAVVLFRETNTQIDIQSECGQPKDIIQLLKYFLAQIPPRAIVQVTIDLHTLDRVSLFTEAGMGNPYLRSPYLQLTRVPDGVSHEKELLKCRILAKAYVADTFLKDVLAFDPKNLDTLFQRVFDEKFEWGGVFKVNGCKQLSIKSLARGSEEYFTVNVSLDHPFTFHTHPLSAYQLFGASLGSPSTADFMITFRALKSQITFVFSVEGIYSIEYHPLFRTFSVFLADSDPQAFQALEYILRTYLSYEQLRDTSRLVADYLEKNMLEDVSAASVASTEDMKEHLQEHLEGLLNYINQLDTTTLTEFQLMDFHGDQNASRLARNQQVIREHLSMFAYEPFQVCRLSFLPWSDVKLLTSVGAPVSFDYYNFEIL